MTDTTSLITLRVTGLGHSLTFHVPLTATVGDVKAEVERQTSLPAAYQLLIAHRKKLEDDAASLMDSLDSSSIAHTFTKIILLHSKLYAEDAEGVKTITALLQEMDELATTTTSNNEQSTFETTHELLTQICCKLDSVDTHGSENLRAMRRRALEKAQTMDESLPKKAD